MAGDAKDRAFDDRLLSFDTQDPVIRKRYGETLDAALETRLSRPRQLQLGAVAFAGLVGCLVAGSLAMTEPLPTSVAVRGLLALFAVFALSWTFLATWTLARGRGRLIPQRTAGARMAFGFTLATVIALSLVTSILGRGAVGAPILASGFALLFLASALLTDVRIERSELLIREQILRLECRLLDLAEIIQPPSKDRADHA